MSELTDAIAAKRAERDRAKTVQASTDTYSNPYSDTRLKSSTGYSLMSKVYVISITVVVFMVASYLIMQK